MNSLITRCLYFLSLVLISSAVAQIHQSTSSSDDIRLNQIGFYPQGPKRAVVADIDATDFKVLSAEGNEIFSGKLSEAQEWPHSKEHVKQADFSAFNTAGEYVLHVPEVGYSHSFEIREDVHFEPAKASLKAFYFQRASTDLPEKFAGKWARQEGHPDTKVKIHNSAATANRPAGSTISSPGGWYDAGDYGKYIVNSGITMATLFSLYEDFPGYMDTLDLNIPESENNLPDLLDETLYNLRWMMTMQDEDGGVFHKLTSAEFHGAVIPKDATYERWVVEKSTTATLDFAAVTAQASRIFRDFEHELPGLSDSLQVMSEKAYRWAKKNPDARYKQNELKNPAISTGAYGDDSLEDEFQWAATELFITTGNRDYYSDAGVEGSLETSGVFRVPSWPNVNTLALYSLVRNRQKFENSEVVDTKLIMRRIIEMADELVDYSENSAYGTPMGVNKSNFSWGSNSVAANQEYYFLMPI